MLVLFTPGDDLKIRLSGVVPREAEVPLAQSVVGVGRNTIFVNVLATCLAELDGWIAAP